MPTRRQQLKRDHERYVADGVLERVGAHGATFLRMGDDRSQPDVLYQLQNGVLGIEVSTVHHANSDARQEWTLAAGERSFPSCGFEERADGVIAEPHGLICERIQAELHDKFEKSYTGTTETWLCIQVRDPLADRESVERCAARCAMLVGHLSRTKGQPFGAVYLRWQATNHTGGRDGFLVTQLLPNQRTLS